MGKYTTPDEAAIRAAALYLSSLSPAFEGRFEAARNLLIRGGWRQDGQAVHFPGGIIVAGRQCSCQEGRGPVVCLHQVAASLLAVATASRTPTAERCDDCGSALTPTTTARIGMRTLTICRPCHYARIAAGRQRQMALDLRMVERALGGGS